MSRWDGAPGGRLSRLALTKAKHHELPIWNVRALQERICALADRRVAGRTDPNGPKRGAYDIKEDPRGYQN